MVFILVHRVLVSSRIPRKGVLVAFVEKAQPAPEKTSWFGVLSWETLPSVHTLTEALPMNLSAPSPALHVRHVSRSGHGVDGIVRRPEARLRPRIEAPLPAIYESKTPVSMAKMIMSRHTYRAPTARRSPSHTRRISVG
ncbi:hypothetical protein B0H12DRAFT_1241485 [Mycena haematopus]|nr:hypothetical protein B0H12DRAFT_1241485 [Mycena haematopus]